MTTVISQGLTIPAGLANGSVADAGQIIPLYNSLNAFNVPGTIGVFQQGFVDDALYTVATGANQDWTIAVPALKSLFVLLPFSWSGAGGAPTIQFRINATNVTAAANMTFSANATGQGLMVCFVGGTDADVPRPFLGLGIETNALGTLKTTTANADLPTAALTSFGIAAAGVTVTYKFKHIRIWAEG